MVSLDTFPAVEQKNERVQRLGKCRRCLNSWRSSLDVAPFTFAIISDGLIDGRVFKNKCTCSGITSRAMMLKLFSSLKKELRESSSFFSVRKYIRWGGEFLRSGRDPTPLPQAELATAGGQSPAPEISTPDFWLLKVAPRFFYRYPYQRQS